jgi:NMD protein affecting ribosome stability and mRNA decay
MKTNAPQRAPHVIKQPARGRAAEHDEYGREHKGIVICPDCGNVHYHKRWWHNSDPGLKKLVSLKYRQAAHTRCPSCAMVAAHLYEGELLIAHVPKAFARELANLVKHVGKTAAAIDPQDRIIATEKEGTDWRITTTENQLTDRLAKKIRDTFKHHTRVRISHSREPYEVDRVRVTFA